MSDKCSLYNPFTSLILENVHLNIVLFLGIITKAIIIIDICLHVMG